jgi:hypothetical protein
MVLLTLIMAGGLSFYRSANLQLNKPQQQVTLSSTMARAKEALIAYAVVNDERPGSLPCPDLSPADGKGDFFATNNCPSNVGWLPWISPLDLPELVDDSSTRLWYVIAPGLRNHSSAHPINSDTATGLTVDGNTDIAALIIAPRGALAGQNRPSNTLSDYLDGENGNGNDNIYVTGPQSATFNDVVLVITRQELMAAVEKRVANEINSCLAQHASSAANTDKRYPWPAPITSTAFQGNTNTLFGRVPSTQPSSGLDAQLKASITKLTEGEQAIANAADANKQLTALNAQAQNILEARNLFDAMYTAFNKVKQLSDDVRTKILDIQNSVSTSAANGRISRSEGTTIRSLSDPTLTDSTLDSLITQLGDTGIDVFPWELKRRNANLISSSDAASLKTQATAIQSLLNATSTPRSDINAYLTPANTAASIAVAAANASLTLPADAALLLAAQNAASALKDAASQLLTSVDNTRMNILSGHVSDYVPPLESLNSKLKTSQTPADAATLLTSLSSTKKSVDAIQKGGAAIVAAKTSASNSLTTASDALKASPLSYALIDSATTNALNDIKALAAAIAVNELIDNNVSRTSLKAALATYQTARSDFISQDTATPRPRQSTITPYAQTLSNATVHIDIWAKSITENATAVAPQAKAAPVPSTTDVTTVNALSSSAYSAAGNALSSVTGKGESAELLQSYIDTPNAANQTAAITALAETTALVNSLLTQANTLGNDLSSTTASAGPLIWLASRCDFLLPSKATWWSNNQWANTVFYQIGAPLMATAGKLTVNGSGSYRVVSIAAGKALTGQNHGTLTISNFLEGSNADASREGQALTPVTGFISKPVSSTFNDRLAY